MAEKITGWSESEDQAIREQLKSVLDSSLFMQSERLGRFLKFVVDETLDGRAARLNQYVIAIDVFDRDESFDPTVDAIVRVEARRLRSKLLEYYDELGCDDPIRILLPKRRYAARFQFRSATDSSASSAKTDSDGESSNDNGEPEATFQANPTIAVMPFVNMSPDPEQEYFADGISEDLITDLSQLPQVSVISRQSTFAYKGTAATVQQVCDELGANIVLEGSVRKVGDSVRITAQLVDGSTGQHLWAQRYDRELGNIFELQDEVNQKIVTALRLELSDSERKKLGHRGTDVIDAHDYVLRGMQEADTMEGSVRARYCFESALQLDPNYASAYARLSLNYIYRWISGWSRSREETIDKGFEFATKAVVIDDQLALAHAALCWAYLWQGEHDKAIAEGQLAIELDPSDVVALERLALCMIFAGDAESSLPMIDKAKRLNPNQTYNFVRGVALFMMLQYDEAIEVLGSDFELNPNFVPSGLYLASSHSLAGHERKAAATIADIRRIIPDYGLAKDFRSHFKNPEDRERFVSGLHQAGLS